MITIAIASDLHCHQVSGKEKLESFLPVGLPLVPWKTNPVEALRRRIEKSNITADILVSPGDLANRCSPQGLAWAWKSINEIGQALNAGRVIATLGNHDVDSHGANRANDPFGPAKGISNAFPLDDEASATRYWADNFCILYIADVRLLVINSVASHTNKDDAKHGAISDVTLERLEESLESAQPADLSLALVHHHPHPHEDLDLGAVDLMHGGQKLITLLSRYDFSLIMHGHKHHPKLSYAQGGASPLTVFAAGSLAHINSGGLASNTRNLFHVVQVGRSDTPGCSVHGLVRSWEFNRGDGWNPATVRSAGFPAQAGFGCRVPPRDLVARIVPRLTGGYVPWSTLEAQLPELRYILPQDKEAIARILSDENDVAVAPEGGEFLFLAKRTPPVAARAG